LHDLDAFVANALQLIENKDLRISMGEKGLEFVKKNFSKKKELADMENLYMTLLEKATSNKY
jgi:hypothetical protein